MSLEYNIQYAEVDLNIVKGDSINISLAVYENDIALDISGMQVDSTIKRKDGLIVKQWSSAGIAPAITMAVNVFNILSSGIDSEGIYDWDVQINDGGQISTIIRGGVIVKKEFTL